MLAQDNVTPIPSGEGSLHRSSWKAEAIRRGNLKISGPFPITEETPLNEEEEKEYAEKGNLSPPPPPAMEDHPHPVQPPPPIPPPNGILHPAPTQAEAEAPPQLSQDNRKLERKVSSAGVREANDVQKRNAPTPAPHSTPSPFPSIPESSTNGTPKKKRKSGLRNVFRKMFGRKSREEQISAHDRDVPVSRHGHHRSEPVTLHESPKMTKEDLTRPRISDLHVRELQPLNPLGQHLPFPMNVNAPQEASPPHEYLTFERPTSFSRRRASLPGALSDAEAQALSGVIGQANKGASSWDERQDGESLHSPQIGIALSSPPHSSQSVQSKRRSRSAGALRDLAKARPSIERRRSAEIRYWRNSYQSGSVYSTATPRPRTAQTVETVHTTELHDEASKAHQSMAASIVEPEPIEAPVIAQHDQDISEIPLPVDVFNFGNLKAGFSDDEHEDERPVVPPPRSEKRLSIEDRVRYLEDNVRDLESSVRRISGRNNRQTIILENAPKGRRSRNRSSSATSDRQGSHHSSKSSNKTLSVTHEVVNPPSPTLGPLSAVNEFPSPGDRPQTMIAIEPNTIPQPAISRTSDVSEQVQQLCEALQHERGARKTLEKQVYSLQREVSELHAIVNKFLSQSPSYPTPSPDAIIASNEERLSTPRASTRPDRAGLNVYTEGDTPATSRRLRETSLSRFSHSGSEGVDDMSAMSSREDVTSPEAWATPKETGSAFGSGFFSRKRSTDADEEMF
ncbi:hypothetical protein K491DRAFT_675319 [Lophiostoma macrostomum CBS 122681]|uniref:Uncharacterized protein n=1 Tax=Lophiostoma macrostomum CBS 122681 TaxID=1314788 RepID=A0A6A6TIG8_9PLEO|nr:hypothetical protein K491DRAFT_675319 [Lophiostoma macrostomum CBS 122681]